MHELDGNRYAHRDGLFARALGRPVEGNPYPTNSEEGVLWKEGWRLIDERRSHAMSAYAGSPASVSALRHQVRSGPSHSRQEWDVLRMDASCAWASLVEIVRLFATGLLLGGILIAISHWVKTPANVNLSERPKINHVDIGGLGPSVRTTGFPIRRCA
jgi:hypothetical protein